MPSSRSLFSSSSASIIISQSLPAKVITKLYLLGYEWWMQGYTANATIIGSFTTRRNEIFHIFIPAVVSRQSAALSFATQHKMLQKVGGKYGTEYLNTRFPLPTPLYYGWRSIKIKISLYIKLKAAFSLKHAKQKKSSQFSTFPLN